MAKNKSSNKKKLSIKNIYKANATAPSPINIETVQASVPIFSIHEQYDLIETYEGCFVKSYLLGDNNYLTAPEEEQRVSFLGWRKVLNSFGTNMEFALTIYNRNINQQDFRDSVLLKETGDEYDFLRKQMNKIITDRITDGRNSIQKDKYLTVAVHVETAEKAASLFHRLDRDINKSMGKIGSFAKPVSLEDRLEILYGIYNNPEEHFISKSRVFDEEGHTKEIRSFDYNHMRAMGLTINDLISPSSIQIKSDKLQVGDKFVRTLRMTEMPSQMNDEFITNVTDMPFNCLTTINYRAIPNKQANALVNKNLSLVRDAKTKQIRQGQQQGIYDDSFINPELLDREAEALALRDDMHERDERLFETVYTVTIFANDEESLDQYTDTLVTEYKKASAQLNTMLNLQEEGFNTSLPLCYNQVAARRTLKSSSASIMMPFSILELNDPGGINYSCNLLSKNLLVYDRLSAENYNGFILGTPGCVDKDTEFFNGKEWKSIADYVEGEKVLQFNIETEEASLVIPERYIKEKCNKMYHFASNGIDQMLSEEHRVIYYDEHLKAQEISAKDFTKKQNNKEFYGKFKTDFKFKDNKEIKELINLYEKVILTYPKASNGAREITLENKSEADAMQFAFSSVGYRVVVENAGNKYSVRIYDNTLIGIDGITVEEVVPVDGYKYCFTVPTHALVLRRNGRIFITGNSGKSFTAKLEMLNVFLKSNADIVVIDPEDEYGALAKLLGGEIIKIVPGGDNHINPMEIVTEYEFEDETSPINAKADFILRLCECIVKNPFGLNSIQETIIDECVHDLFDKYVLEDGRIRTIPNDEMPTLSDLQRLLAGRREAEARELAMALKLYTGNGSLNVFGTKTNVQTHARFVVYQIKDVGDRLKNLAMLTILDHIWNQIVMNRQIGKATWFYVDEIYLLFQNEYSASFLNTLFRRARKYMGVPTGITQNVSPLLESSTARDMLQNCNFIQILAQAGPDRDRLQEILNLSEAQIDYITSSPKGQGLLYTGKNVVPFFSQFPKNNDVYKCLTSDLREIKAFEAAEKRENARRMKENKGLLDSSNEENK